MFLDIISIFWGGAVLADEPPEPTAIEEVDYIHRLVTEYAEEYEIDPKIMHHIVEKESQYDPEALGDRHLTCNSSMRGSRPEMWGKQMSSRGLVQISDCYWDFTKEQVEDPHFALTFLAEQLNEGRCYLWSTCPANKLAYK